MIDQDSLQDYTPPQPKVESVHGDRLAVYCGDEMPTIGTALGINVGGKRLWAVVDRHAGARRVEAWLPLRPEEVEPGLAVTISERPAAFQIDQTCALTPSPRLIRPAEGDDHLLWPEAPDWTELGGALSPLPIGIEPLDVLAPICAGGVNMIIDHSDDGRPFAALARRVDRAFTPHRRLLVAAETSPLASTAESNWQVRAGETTRSQLASLQIAIGLASALRECDQALALIELPGLTPFAELSPSATAPAAPTGMPEIIDRLSRHLVSTKTSSLTTLLHLHIPGVFAGLADIIETLRLGDVDATIYLDEQGRFEPGRSTSRAAVDGQLQKQRRQYLQILQLADRAREKSAIFGDHDLTDEEIKALQTVPSLHPSLAK